jgi:3-oxoacid CoA-transferase
MAMDKIVSDAAAAVADIPDGATVLVGGFGVLHGWPTSLLQALRDKGSRDLTIICNIGGVGPTSPQILAENGQIRKIVSSYGAVPKRNTPLDDAIRAGKVDLELVPQGTLIERIRAGGSGLAAFYTPTGVGTDIAHGKEEREFGGKRFLLETAIRADFALVRAWRGDAHGNLVYEGSGRNFHPLFATAADVTIAEVDEAVAVGELDPETVVTPGINVDRVVRCETSMDMESLIKLSIAYGKATDLEVRDRAVGPRGIPPDMMAMRAARLLRRGEYVNLGLGLPALVSNYIRPEDDITFHSENGVLGYGPLAAEGEANPQHYNASGHLVTLLPGASFFETSQAFAMARSGRVTSVVLGGFQLSSGGDLANWSTAAGVGGIGGAMDLAAGSARVLLLMFHLTRDGTSKLVEHCTYPLTARACVSTVVTDLAVIDVDREGFLLREVAPGVSVEEVQQVTAAPLRVADDVREMVF